MAADLYGQPTKKRAREQILTHAVKALTCNRSESVIVQRDELLEVIYYALSILQNDAIAGDTADEYHKWDSLYQTRMIGKLPADLKVLYLCGPEPLNDLNVLIANGINPHNVWAIESQEQNVADALEELRNSNTAMKIHPGSLSEFFQHYTDKFDLVYYDACGTFLDGKPNTLDPVLKLLEFDRLEPLSVLITNFAQIQPERLERLTSILTAYFRFRYNDLPQAFWSSNLDPEWCAADSSELQKLIQKQPEPFYSDFITRFVCDLARYWIPNCRALGFKAVADDYLLREGKDAVLEAAQYVPHTAKSIEEFISRSGHMQLSPSSYPLFSFFRVLKQMKPQDPLVNQLNQMRLIGNETSKLLGFASILDKVIEGHWDCLSKPMVEAVWNSWFDQKNHFSCDVPMPNLLVNSLLGIYGLPYFPNPKRCLRLKYRAKETTMFTDAFVLDRCRYFFDWFPTVRSVADRFKSRGFQIVARCLMDRIGRADFGSDSHPFRFSAVLSIGDTPAAKVNCFETRETIQ
jgi:hypothetical protein